MLFDRSHDTIGMWDLISGQGFQSVLDFGRIYLVKLIYDSRVLGVYFADGKFGVPGSTILGPVAFSV